MSNIFETIKNRHLGKAPFEMTMSQFLEGAKKDPSYYAPPAKRILTAIGEPELVDTSKDPRLSRLHQSKVIKRYKAFSDFYGLEHVIEQIVQFFKCSSQGLEESKQILYLLGPVGSAKSSLAIRLRELMQKEPIYILKGSPVQESPLGLFDVKDADVLGVPERYLKAAPSPWAVKRLKEFKGDINKFIVQKVWPDEAIQRGIAVATPGDPNTQDISTLVGKVDIRKLENLSQSDPDAYSYSGALCKANQGMLEFVEMFKADVKLLNPLLTATQEGNYVGTENIGLVPFNGLVIAHSNETEWKDFKDDKKNEAIIDRVTLVKVPYVLSLDEEVSIYEKLIRESELSKSPIAPGTLELLASVSVASRLEENKTVPLEVKMQVYNGENVGEKYPNTPSPSAFKAEVTNDEGFSGVSTRQAFKILSKVYNYDHREVAANPVHLFIVLRDTITDGSMRSFIDGYLTDTLFYKVRKDIQMSFLGSGMDELGQNKFERYVVLAEHWLEDNDFRNPDTGQLLDRNLLNQELEAIEKPAKIGNPKDFRAQVVRFSLSYQAQHNGAMPKWSSYHRFRDVLETSMFNQMDDMLPVLSVSGKGTDDQRAKHKTFVKEMTKKGYTARQVQLVVDWFLSKQTKR